MEYMSNQRTELFIVSESTRLGTFQPNLAKQSNLSAPSHILNNAITTFLWEDAEHTMLTICALWTTAPSVDRS